MIDPTLLQGRGMTSQRTRDRLAARLRDEGITDPRVLEVMRTVPRHIFVDEALASRSYDDTALPIGHGQTISQPYIVARMTELLTEQGLPERVLEIGTGSGYQAAVLAQLGVQVYTIERIKALSEQARERFRALKLWNIRARYGDGSNGWPQYAPYDGIVLTAAPEAVPQALFEQLAPGGRMVAPVGDANRQELVIFERADEGIVRRVDSEVSFVPMLGGEQ
ncbi:protein-L-isoaspartate O-methyltransferase [Alkalilimnicola ehrlichii]|uniref:Protein-L-isoaspartate O-methyltransferase n=1 Tax=Alkalilimnicola ehrlichii TaxID=351052 RepID=A0A3E0WSB2_9GAMM|nr:protein-L-isoaspartate(D-aspartate) O-methyltransferase [Alkalilimnicola ehrlichii]RFA28265.1 protein-L-isoaspartate O-methyltransferase [Alkalilimnicola ehrlichii]RFA34866.1 protein-L-isoaspartate O-methyltransferase [Alkalilimnicola ehrlichii]